MTSKIVSCQMAKRVRVFSALGAFAAVSLLPGAMFADNAVDGSLPSEPFATASVDAASVAPVSSHALSGSVGDVAVDEPSVQSKKRATFDMSHVERIRLRVWGNSDLSGEYTIDPDYSLSIPRIGRIEIGAMTSADLELMLAQKLSALTRIDVTVSVEVAQFRPYFIMGHVAEAGAIEWRPGLKVIQAISLARGVLRSDEGLTHPIANRQSRTQLTFSLAQLARLKAEREGADAVATTERIATLIKSVPETSRMALTTLITRQNDMLSEQRNIMETQIVGLRREREAAQRELEAAETQEKAVREQLEITRAQLANIEGLKDKKLVSNTRYFEQKSDLLLVEVRYAETHSMVERARARLSSIDQQLVMVPQQRRAVLSERIDTLEREVAQLELASGVSAAEGEDQGDVLKLSYHIARESASGVRTIPATVFTEILPGDVLIVSEGQDKIGAVSTDDGARPPAINGGAKDASADEAQRMIEDAAIDPSLFFRRASSSAVGRGHH